MRYTLRPGYIASVLYVQPEDGRTLDCLYIAENLPVQVWPNRTIEVLPGPVRAAVNKHFGTVFSLPSIERGAFLQSLEPWEVEG